MANADNYTILSGADLHAGVPIEPPYLDGDVVVAGDSLTDLLYNSCGSRLGFPMMRFPPRIIGNSGWQAQTISDLVNRFQNDVIDRYPSAQTIVIRIGTNGPGTGTYQSGWQALMDMMEAAGKFGIFHQVPPRGTTAGGADSVFIAANAWLKAACEAHPDRLAYIEDSNALAIDAHYNIDNSYTVGDGIHMNGKGIYAQAVAMAPQFAALFPPINPLLADPTDKYISNPASNQYVRNPQMSGTGGTVVGMSGVAPDLWRVEGASASGAVSIVPADAGEEAYGPWIRMSNLTSSQSGAALYVSHTLEHPAIAADHTIERFDIVCEMRFNNFDPSVLSLLQTGLKVVGFGGAAVPGGTACSLSGNTGTWNFRLTPRSSWPRTQQISAGNSAPLAAYGANSIEFLLTLAFNGAHPTSMGSIDIRCVSVRGEDT